MATKKKQAVKTSKNPKTVWDNWRRTEKLIAVAVGAAVLVGGYLLIDALAAPPNVKYNAGGFAAYVRCAESRGNYRATNGRSSASGAYQFIDGTWRGIPRNVRGNASRAYLASPAQQDAAFRHVWSTSGSKNWNASGAAGGASFRPGKGCVGPGKGWRAAAKRDGILR